MPVLRFATQLYLLMRAVILIVLGRHTFAGPWNQLWNLQYVQILPELKIPHRAP